MLVGSLLSPCWWHLPLKGTFLGHLASLGYLLCVYVCGGIGGRSQWTWVSLCHWIEIRETQSFPDCALSADWVLGSGGRWVWPRTPTQRGAFDNLLAVERERDGLLLPSPSSQRTQPLLICLFVFVLVFLGCRSLQSPVWGTGDIR